MATRWCRHSQPIPIRWRKAKQLGCPDGWFASSVLAALHFLGGRLGSVSLLPAQRACTTPVFLAIPILARRNSLLAKIATPIMGIINTVFTMWVLGMNSGTEVFLIP